MDLVMANIGEILGSGPYRLGDILILIPRISVQTKMPSMIG
jgi:hypothetical protein